MKPEDILRATIISKETVNLPGLGSFIKRFVDAKFDNVTKQFFPPHFEIYFDKSLNTNDTFFNQALFSNGYKTDQIADIIAKLIDDIKRLTNEETFEISDIGYFKNVNGDIVFVFNNNYSTDFNNFGFETLKLNEVKIEKNEEVKDQVKASNLINKVEIVDIKKDTSNEIKKNKTKLKFNWIYVIIPLIFIALFSIIYFTNSYKYLANIKLFKKETKNIKPIVIDTNKTKNNEEFNLDEDIKKIVNAKIKNIANVYLGSQYKKFYIVCNSFENKQNAENFAFQLRQKGYNTEIVNGNKYFRVTIGSYNDVDLMLKEYQHFQVKQENDIWILINKK